nr:PTS transporter subunit EIIB [Entomoplasma sp. MP1]
MQLKIKSSNTREKKGYINYFKNAEKANNEGEDKYTVMAKKIIEALGEDNIVSIDNCMTRLRLVLKDNSKIDEKKLKKLVPMV